MSYESVGEELIERLQRFGAVTELRRRVRSKRTDAMFEVANAIIEDDRAALAYESATETACEEFEKWIDELFGEDLPKAPTTRPAQMDSVCGKPKPDADREPKTTPIQVKR